MTELRGDEVANMQDIWDAREHADAALAEVKHDLIMVRLSAIDHELAEICKVLNFTYSDLIERAARNYWGAQGLVSAAEELLRKKNEG